MVHILKKNQLCGTSSRDLFKETHFLKKELEKEREQKSQAPGSFWTAELLITRPELNRP